MIAGALLAMSLATATPNVIWEPYHGSSQESFLDCPYFEVLYEGTRGPGKSDALLMDFVQHVGQGHGRFWRGILFRQAFPDLTELVEKSFRLFPLIFPDATYNQQEHVWRFATGESLRFAHIKSAKEYTNYHGHEYPWIGWDELGTYASPDLYDTMKSCCRSSRPGMPRKYRSTANPYGLGHNWLKRRFIDPAPPGVAIRDAQGNARVRIHGHWSENKKLLESDPEYIQRMLSDRNKHRRKAWVDGSWDVVAGGMFDDLWDGDVHVLRGWAPKDTPASWRLDRTFDWGSAKPFSLGWWAESDGTPAPDGTHYARGTLFRIAEWYGWDGENANEGIKLTDQKIAEGGVEREAAMQIRGRVKAGAADSSIFAKKPGEKSTGEALEKAGLSFTPAAKEAGSRKAGAQKIRGLLEASAKWAEARRATGTAVPMEHPGMFVFEACRDGFLRTVPTIQRSEKDPEDVDTDAEDHAFDETRYRVHTVKREAGSVPGWGV